MSSTGVKRKRVLLIIETKVQIIEQFKKVKLLSNLASEYEIGVTTVRD